MGRATPLFQGCPPETSAEGIAGLGRVRGGQAVVFEDYAALPHLFRVASGQRTRGKLT